MITLSKSSWAVDLVDLTRPEKLEDGVWMAVKISSDRDSSKAKSDSFQIAAVYDVGQCFESNGGASRGPP